MADLHAATEIDSADDARLRPYADLRHAKAGDPRSDFIAEGRWVVERLVASGQRIHSVLVQTGRENLLPPGLPPDVPRWSVSKPVIRQLVGYDFHRGVLACGIRKPESSVADLIDHLGLQASRCKNGVRPTHHAVVRDRSIVLALMNVTCPENLGSLLRTASALGIDQILIGPGTLDHLARRVIRVSMGAAFFHRFYRMSAPEEDLLLLRDEHGFGIVATSLGEDAATIDHWNRSGNRHVLMLGNEADGLERRFESLATQRVTIPMHNETDSLNVAVAGAIFMHELCRHPKS